MFTDVKNNSHHTCGPQLCLAHSFSLSVVVSSLCLFKGDTSSCVYLLCHLSRDNAPERSFSFSNCDTFSVSAGSFSSALAILPFLWISHKSSVDTPFSFYSFSTYCLISLSPFFFFTSSHEIGSNTFCVQHISSHFLLNRFWSDFCLAFYRTFCHLIQQWSSPCWVCQPTSTPVIALQQLKHLSPL